MKDLIADVYNIIENGISNNAERELLAQSLFYYCSGIDPTPIIAFGSDYPLYIYSDIIDYGNGDFNKTMNVLYERLFKAGFVCVDNKRITHLKTIQNIEVTLWKAEGNLFSLAYIQHDAVMSFQKYIQMVQITIFNQNAFVTTEMNLPGNQTLPFLVKSKKELNISWDIVSVINIRLFLSIFTMVTMKQIPK